ncbi:hypothetical protein C1645_821834 [Glomus cerebriforme]|uniref:Restriction endonuclease type IV Mrr domain-containing protein n=1 Tax=Glomus cerebriforme TaxID=658196 RepID=A0A397T1A9_9GLOM|nr:hypothetical protein C1645_821834 [Glomus cerebriforme]
MNFVARGNNFENQVESILRNGNIETYKIRLSNGDGGVDLMGNYGGNLLLIQCKSSPGNKVTKANVRELKGVMSKYPVNTIGVFVVPSKTENYTRRAIEEARNSKFKIILTDKSNICNEIEIHSEDYVENDNYIQFHVQNIQGELKDHSFENLD